MTAPPKTLPKKRVHPVDEMLPLPRLATYGFQHVVAFYAGAVLVPILIATAVKLPNEDLVKLITADLFTCGIASIIQAVGFWKIGVRLPLLQGVTFAGVSPIIAIGVAHGGGSSSRAFALIEIAKIANYRFEDLVADANPIAAARFGRLDELP